MVSASCGRCAGEAMSEGPRTDLLRPEDARRRRRRSIAIALALGAFAVLFYVLTLAKLGPQLFNRPM